MSIKIECKGSWLLDNACGKCTGCQATIPDAKKRIEQLNRQNALLNLSQKSLLNEVKRLKKLSRGRLAQIRKLKGK